MTATLKKKALDRLNRRRKKRQTDHYIQAFQTAYGTALAEWRREMQTFRLR